MRAQPDNERGRPRTGPATSEQINLASSVPAGIRRRRDAAHRSAPLPNGYRDPLDVAASDPFRRPASITHDSAARVFRVKGYGVRDVLRAAGMKPIQTVGGFLLDLYRLPDAVAALEHAGYRVNMREGAV